MKTDMKKLDEVMKCLSGLARVKRIDPRRDHVEVETFEYGKWASHLNARILSATGIRVKVIACCKNIHGRTDLYRVELNEEPLASDPLASFKKRAAKIAAEFAELKKDLADELKAHPENFGDKHWMLSHNLEFKPSAITPTWLDNKLKG